MSYHSSLIRQYYVGLDLGQKQDYTALSVIERVEIESGIEYHVRYLDRFPLGTLYPDIVRQVIAKLSRLEGTYDLIVDATGVGIPLLDMIKEMELRPIGVWITGGDIVNPRQYGFTVPKRDLVSNLVVLFENNRLKIAKDLKDIDQLLHELHNLKRKRNISTGHDSYEAWRESDHDDLVLSIAVALWYAVLQEKGEEYEAAMIF